MKLKFLVAPLALGAVIALGGCSAADRINAGAYTTGGIEIKDEINKIDIDFPEGTVMIKGTDNSDCIGVSEPGDNVAWRRIGSTLYIKACIPGEEAKKGSLSVTVPASKEYNEIEVRSSGAAVALRNISAGRADIISGSGDVSVLRCKISDEAELETEDGDITVTGQIKDYDIESTNGNISISAQSAPEDVDAETVNGNIKAYFPSDASFKAKVKSGNYVDTDLKKSENGKYIHGDGKYPYFFSAVSGVISISAAVQQTDS